MRRQRIVNDTCPTCAAQRVGESMHEREKLALLVPPPACGHPKEKGNTDASIHRLPCAPACVGPASWIFRVATTASTSRSTRFGIRTCWAPRAKKQSCKRSWPRQVQLLQRHNSLSHVHRATLQHRRLGDRGVPQHAGRHLAGDFLVAWTRPVVCSCATRSARSILHVRGRA